MAELAFKKSHPDPRNFILNHLTILSFSKDRNAKGSIVFHLLFCSAGQGTQLLGCSDSEQRLTHPQPLRPWHFGEWGNLKGSQGGKSGWKAAWAEGDQIESSNSPEAGLQMEGDLEIQASRNPWKWKEMLTIPLSVGWGFKLISLKSSRTIGSYAKREDLWNLKTDTNFDTLIPWF